MTSSVGTAPPATLSILQIGTQFNLGGIPRHMLTLTEALRESGHEVTLAGTPGTWCDTKSEPGFLDLPIRFVASEGGSLPRRLGHLAVSIGRLRRWLGRHRVDLIHTHESAPALVAMLARLGGRRIPVAVTYHGSEPERVRTFCRTARHCDLVITPSHTSARDLVEVGGLPEDLVEVIGLGLPPAPENPAAEVEALRAELLGDGERLVVTVARMAHQKGIDTLIECVERLKESHSGYRFVLVGGGHLEAEYRQLAEQRGVLGHLRFVGRSERVHLYLEAADLFLLTSRYEAFGLVVLEAFQVGLPSISTACAGIDELIDDSVGRTVPVGDVDAICQAVVELLSDEDRLRRLGAAALARSREDRFDPAWMRARFEAAYQRLAGSAGPMNRTRPLVDAEAKPD